jgi:hypothetical protein
MFGLGGWFNHRLLVSGWSEKRVGRGTWGPWPSYVTIQTEEDGPHPHDMY